MLALKHQVIAVLNLGLVEVRPAKLEGCMAMIHLDTSIVEIDVEAHKAGSLVDSLCHEVIHYLCPKALERWVIKRTAYCVAALTEKEHAWLVQFLKDHSCWEER